MYNSALPFLASYAPDNSYAQDIEPLALTVGVLIQSSTRLVPIQHLSQPYSPPFSKGGFLFVRIYCTMVETSSGLPYFRTGIKVTSFWQNPQSSGSPPHD